MPPDHGLFCGSLVRMTPFLVGATTGFVLLLVGLERTTGRWRLLVKVVASTGFVAIAFASGALDTGYGKAVLAGLCLSWIGDVLLALPSRRAFLGGLVAFLLGHVAYVVGFAVRGLRWAIAAGVAVVVVAVAGAVWRWLRPHLDREMVTPVAVYVAVISAMMVMAVATGGFRLDERILVGAGLFYLSDLFVARQRFVTPGFTNRLIGLPLYYAGQVLLALSAGG